MRTKVKKRCLRNMIFANIKYRIGDSSLVRFALKPNLQFILLLIISLLYLFFLSFFFFSSLSKNVFVMFCFVLFVLVRSPNRFGLIHNGRGD